MTERSQIVTAARDTIAQGSQSFAAASKLFAPVTRERAWLLYAWCRAADDLTDGQELGHNAALQARPEAAQAELEVLTRLALDSSQDVPPAFAALRLVAHETAMPRSFIADHLAGFALDAAGWRPQTTGDLLQYCYHVAGSVGCMMAVVMGVSPEDDDTLDRACDLGLAFQLANIARDIVPDAQVGRCYLPAQWLKEAGLSERDLADPPSRRRNLRQRRLRGRSLEATTERGVSSSLEGSSAPLPRRRPSESSHDRFLLAFDSSSTDGEDSSTVTMIFDSLSAGGGDKVATIGVPHRRLATGTEDARAGAGRCPG